MIGTVVIDERIYPIAELGLRRGVIETFVRIRGPAVVPALVRDTEYRIHGEDGSLVWRGRLAEAAAGGELAEHDVYELHLTSEVTGKLAESI
jgi:hypothetical protein